MIRLHVFVITVFVILTFLYPDDVMAHNHNDDKCGTFHFSEKSDQILSRPITQKTSSSPSGRFLIHYDVIGNHAVSPTDIDNNGTPDWVDSVAYYFEYAHRLEVDTLGYPEAPEDDGGETNQYDVYIQNTGLSGYYGITQLDGRTDTGAYPKFKTYIVIDNDYSINDTSTNGGKTFATYGYDGLKCTAVHEYFHAIQIGCYGRTDNFSAFYEMASTWVEWRAFPEITDYIYQARSFFKNPQEYYFGRPEGFYGYKYGPFIIYLSLRFGDNIIKDSWIEVGKGQAPYRALDLSLRKRGSSLNNVWCDFIPLTYRTGYRSKGLSFPSEIPKAHLYPALKEMKLEQYSAPSFTISNRIQAFALFLARCVLPQEGTNTPDTADFILTNPNATPIFSGLSGDASMTFRLTSSEQLEKRIDGTPFFWEYRIDGNTTCTESILTSGFITEGVEYCFPSPYRPEQDDKLFFPAPSNSRVGREIHLSVSTLPTNTLVYETTGVVSAVQFENRGAQRVVVWENPPNDLATGTYLYVLRYFDTVKVGKFSVKR